jgi:DNA polymerase I-like protein with 3'-5' exonuclease and polymerase domains
VETSTVDFETGAIRSRPQYPPKPVGAAIRWPNGEKEYLAWGHPEGNNTDIGTARSKIKDAYKADRVLFHHGAFDMDVGECHLNIKPPKRFDDTLFQAFLLDPHAQELDLKGLAADHLDMAPDEQDRLREWIIDHIPAARKKPSSWGEYIDQAPGGLVGKYAIGDVSRTYRLDKKMMPEVDRRGMREAYERELKCVPITLEMERSGVRIDVKRLKKGTAVFEQMDRDVLRRIAKKLRLDPKNMKSPENPKGFNLNSGVQLADAMIKAHKLDKISRTPTGKVSTKIALLQEGCNDKELLNLLAIHSVANKTISSFMHPWMDQCILTGDRLLPKFNQVRGYDEGGGGARSGRYSSSDPNMQNISANVEESKNKDVLLLMQKLLKDEYDYPFIGLRDYIIPDDNCVMICVDYNQQELRLLAHFEKDVLMRAYIENPMLDVHTFCQQLVKDITGIEFPRKAIKTTVFGIIYGMGVDKLAVQMDADKDTAKQVRDGILEAVPGISKLMKQLKRLARRDEPLRTWGGREYFCEEPKFVKKYGRWMSFDYKMLNYQIQPSAADVTKQGMIQVKERVPEARIAVQVHDELVCMVPRVRKVNIYGKRIIEAMCDMEFNVPMMAEAKYATRSWARAVDYSEFKEAA